MLCLQHLETDEQKYPAGRVPLTSSNLFPGKEQGAVGGVGWGKKQDRMDGGVPRGKNLFATRKPARKQTHSRTPIKKNPNWKSELSFSLQSLDDQMAPNQLLEKRKSADHQHTREGKLVWSFPLHSKPVSTILLFSLCLGTIFPTSMCLNEESSPIVNLGTEICFQV